MCARARAEVLALLALTPAELACEMVTGTREVLDRVVGSRIGLASRASA